MTDLRPNYGRGMARLNSLSKKCELCQNCITYINGTCSGNKSNIKSCPEYDPETIKPERYKEYDLMDDEEITS